MRTVKTRSSKRSTYTYRFGNGESKTLKPGTVDPATGYILSEEDIQRLHRMDDREVDNNLKNAKPPIQPWEKRLIEEWKKAHPYEDLPSRSNVSLDAIDEDDEGIDDDAGKGYLGAASLVMMEQEDPMVERLLEVVEMLRPDQKELLRRIVYEEEGMADVAEDMGLESSVIRHRMKAIREFIKKNF